MRLSVCLLSALCALPLSGCVAVAAGAAAGYGTAQIVRNSDVRDYDAPFSTTWAATVASMRDAGFPVAADVQPAGNVGRLAIGDAVVDVSQVTETSSRVRVRIGTFTTEAHRQSAGRIHDGIGQRVVRP